ncbi:hypothetical protein EVAR_11507_1 [Eumeta japonica]|uniref:Uncharacterized protein n=1 Tax=Eumeta variegata TaxID=151549 RepID=A0A4C1TYQ4_EUMVA|nr:hypothetical protein EVAR_11507_1 [Eumeta japonica]
MALNRNAGEKDLGVINLRDIIRRQFIAAEFRALYCTGMTKRTCQCEEAGPAEPGGWFAAGRRHGRRVFETSSLARDTFWQLRDGVRVWMAQGR